MSMPPINAFPGAVRASSPPEGRTAEAENTAAEGFGDLLSALLGGQGQEGFLGRPATSPAGEFQEQASQLAEMFNEHGLFLGASALRGSHSSGAAPSLPRMPDEDSTKTGVHVHPAASLPGRTETGLMRAAQGREGDAIDGAQRAQPSSALERAMPSAGAGVPRTASAPVRAVLSARFASFSARAPSPYSEVPDGSAPEQASPEDRAARLVEEFLQNGSAASTQLVVQEGESGLDISARMDRLNREERSRLRGEIAMLLATHGLTAGEIRLNGEPGPGSPFVKGQ